MLFGRFAILLVFVGLLALPFAVGSRREAVPDAAQRVIIVTPHNEQIRTEFGRGFDAWHRDRYGEPAVVVWNTPGGTSEIRKMLFAQYEAALRDGRAPGGSADLMFGGGSYEHGLLKGGITVIVDGAERSCSVSVPVEIEPAMLERLYGPNIIGSLPLYDPDRHWFGTALSGFGLVYNVEVLEALDVPRPGAWENLADPRLRGWVGLVNPGQSGSVTTAFEIILQRLGWAEGWRILRRAGANARYFAASSPRPARDVSMGDAAMGISIDFYGRYQAQAIADAGGGDRVGYVDPPGETTIDPDPISMLRGAPNPQSARRFVEFCLTPEGQALWQYRAREDGGGLGPRRFELRRMPALRSMYEPPRLDNFVDRVNPFEIAAPLEGASRDVRAYIAVVFAAMTMDAHDELRAAWTAIVEHPAYPGDSGIVTAADVGDPVLREMLDRFDAMPAVPAPGGGELSLDGDDHLSEIKTGWLRGGWRDEGLWHPDARPADILRRRFAVFFRRAYRDVVEIASSPREEVQR
jgi:ABC-type thiamine transport system substrate-binding protein